MNLSRILRVSNFYKLSNSLSQKPLIFVRQSTSDAPVNYSKSKAAKWKAAFSRKGTPTADGDGFPWFQPFIINFSLAIFLVYFCCLREENDIDDLLTTSLYERIDGLEESQLRSTLTYYRSVNEDTKKIENRLEEINKLKSK